MKRYLLKFLSVYLLSGQNTVDDIIASFTMSVSSQLQEIKELISPYKSLQDNYVSNKRNSGFSRAALAATGCLIVLGIVLAVSVIERLNHEDVIRESLNSHPSVTCDQTAVTEQSRIVLVESIPHGVDYGINTTQGENLYEAWKHLLSLATEQIDVVSFHWSLLSENININSSTDVSGKDILKEFKALPSRNISVRVVTGIPSPNSTDLKILRENGIQIRRVNFGRLTKGILHTKLWIVDRRHVYMGSANMNWRAFTQVKELGVVIYNSSSLAADLHKIFQSYWVMGRPNASIPEPWPPAYDTLINAERPLLVNLSGVPSKVYFTASPPVFCPDSRTSDLDAVLSFINGAQEFIHVSLTEYYPASKIFQQHRYWALIEDALRRSAFERSVSVCLLVSCALDTDPSVWPFLRSLDALHSPSHRLNIQVRLFVIPTGNQSHIPFGKVNHSPFMVTDKVAYIGTSNWSADYFNTTAGVSFVISQDALPSALPGNTFQGQLGLVFDRDWNSQFAIPLSELNPNHDCIFSRSA